MSQCYLIPVVIVGLTLNIGLGCTCGCNPEASDDPELIEVPVDANAITTVPGPNEPDPPLTLEGILARTQAASQQLQSLECQLIYDFLKPDWDSKTTRKGRVFYQRQNDRSDLRIRFDTKKEDEIPEVRYREDMYFDGIWQTHIDYQGRSVQKRQLAPADDPIDALELVSDVVPIFGFSGMEKMRDAYQISYLPKASTPTSSSIHLRLIPDPNGPAKHEYLGVDVWLNPEYWLPTLVEAENLEEEIFRLEFPEQKINQPLPADVFKVQIPQGFGTPKVYPLQ